MPQADLKNTPNTHAPKVGLFITCLVDLFRPQIGFATVKLLEQAGCRVDVPSQQTCCGQPAYNSGDLPDTRAIAEKTIAAFSNYDYVVAPSGSCVGQIRKYPGLFEPNSDAHARAVDLANRTWEIMSFWVDVLKKPAPHTSFSGKVTYHDSCSGMRHLKIKDQPRQLLCENPDLVLEEMDDTEACCGFGGTFCVKYPDISTRMVSDKIQQIDQTGADTVLGGDLGCLMNIAGRMHRQGKTTRVRHAVEVLADMADGPAIGEEE
ncbi:MAG: (Fe-S)-binding protein [Gammaproteobacteria bacterium]|nr:(Fe-S)-binding protein [Gammaproteobacteria bacterium]